jgi:radical SAM protein with 4Fe4S-binding SPASM domain
LGRLFKINKGRIKFGCGPAIDIGPDMTVWGCFPMSKYQKKSIYEFNSMQDIFKFYEDLHRKVRIEAGGIFEKCDTCLHREDGVCAGGCLAHNLAHFINEAPIRFKEVYMNE